MRVKQDPSPHSPKTPTFNQTGSGVVILVGEAQAAKLVDQDKVTRKTFLKLHQGEQRIESFPGAAIKGRDDKDDEDKDDEDKVVNATETDPPADIEPGDMFHFRERNGAWLKWNRDTIEQFSGRQWYVTDDGIKFAIRLPADRK